jgi:hypothetical protein
MHLGGKAMDMRAVYPTGESETLLHVPKYDFNWQINYYFPAPKLLPRGTKLGATGTSDNSANNRFNPDPNTEIRWGDQSWEEMLLAVAMLQIDPNADLDKLFQSPPKREQQALFSQQGPRSKAALRAAVQAQSFGIRFPPVTVGRSARPLCM